MKRKVLVVTVGVILISVICFLKVNLARADFIDDYPDGSYGIMPEWSDNDGYPDKLEFNPDSLLPQTEGENYYWGGGSLEEMEPVGTGYPFIKPGDLGNSVAIRDNILTAKTGVGNPHTETVYTFDLVTGILNYDFYGDDSHLQYSPTGEYFSKGGGIPKSVKGRDINLYRDKIQSIFDIVTDISSSKEISDPGKRPALISIADYLKMVEGKLGENKYKIYLPLITSGGKK